MLLDRLFENLMVSVSPFDAYEVSQSEQRQLDSQPSVSLHFVLRGAGSFVGASGHPLPVRDHTLVLVPRGIRHAVRGSGMAAEAPLTIACGRIDVQYGERLGLFDHLHQMLVLDFSETPQMRSTFVRLLEETRRGATASGAMMRALMNECLVLVFRRLCDEPKCPLPWLTALDDPGLASVLDLVLARPDGSHSVESLAATAGMSRSTFAREFARRFGKSPMAFVREVRLRHAVRLLETTSLGMDAIARRVGFSSRSHFSRVFTARFGRAPTHLRLSRSRADAINDPRGVTSADRRPTDDLAWRER